MSEVWTVRRVVDWAARDFVERGIDSPRLDAELLVADALDTTRVKLYMDLDRPLVGDELAAVKARIVRRRAREPVAYILGHRDFHGIRLAVDARVLIPRPDTEVLVERALAALPADAPSTLLDLCTGTGAVPLAVLKARASVTATATDVSPDALAVAAANATALGMETRITLVRCHLADAVDPDARFDVVTANPPYIASAEVATLMPEVAKYEPRLALDGGADGLSLYPALVALAAARLVPGGVAAFEVGAGQAATVAEMFHAEGSFEEPSITLDYGRVQRVVEARLRPR